MNTVLRRVLDVPPSFADHACHGLQVAVSGICDAVYLHGPLTDAERKDILDTVERERARIDKLETYLLYYKDQKD